MLEVFLCPQLLLSYLVKCNLLFRAALPIFKQKQISDELLKTMEETEKEADKLLEGLFKRLGE